MSSKTPVRTVWRGAASSGEDDDNDVTGGRILLLMDSESNRRLLKEHLPADYRVVEPAGEAFPTEPFDLAIVDRGGFRRWYPQLTDAKTREEPTFLPVILVLPKSELRRRLRAFWDTVDEFVVTPLDRNEFMERIAMLLRARRMAVAQRSRLAYLVNHDRATGLPNKTLFMDRLAGVIRDASVLDWQVAVAVVHIPLTRILKSLGHRGLERAAKACSTRLRALLGENVSLARLTTEEWGLIHHDKDATTSVLDVCAKVTKLADQPIVIDDERIHIVPRMGVALYPEDAADANNLLDFTMSALSEAKGNEPAFYSAKVQRQALRFIRTEARLYEALEKEQFELWYQPQLDLASGRVVGVESLVRWRLPGGELVPPNDFIPVAEASGIIHEIDRWVLRTACQVMGEWKRRGIAIGRVAVNVSANDLRARDFVDTVENMLQQNALPPPTLELEITETMLFEIGAENLGKLQKLKDSGVFIAVDDFGTGYSSLSYLHRLPITTLKIDKSFVDEVDVSSTDEAVARAIVWLAENFGLETVAEGIETQAQAEKLRAMGVKTGQGFLYARPMPEAALLEWLEKSVGTALKHQSR